MLFGLAIGLAIAAAAYWHARREPLGPQPAPVSASEPPASLRDPAGEAPTEAAGTRFDFYEILPKYEVVIPEVESPPRAEPLRTSTIEPGRYVLQAGSFRAAADADRMQATLALLGIESRIQRVTIDDDVFHRVRIGPISDASELDRVRERLRQSEIDALLMRVP
jgi:cell division protein FtsN